MTTRGMSFKLYHQLYDLWHAEFMLDPAPKHSDEDYIAAEEVTAKVQSAIRSTLFQARNAPPEMEKVILRQAREHICYHSRSRVLMPTLIAFALGLRGSNSRPAVHINADASATENMLLHAMRHFPSALAISFAIKLRRRAIARKSERAARQPAPPPIKVTVVSHNTRETHLRHGPSRP